MIIDIEKFKDALELINAINSADLAELRLMYNNSPNTTYRFSEEKIKEWEYIGGDNIDLLELYLRFSTHELNPELIKVEYEVV